MSEQLSLCGIDCGICGYREQFNCQGCQAAKGKMPWGECQVATCCLEKQHEHCGHCSDFVCQQLHDFSYDKEHGDNGQRIENLRKAMGR